MGSTIVDILNAKTSYTGYRLSFIIAFAMVALATIDRFLPVAAFPLTRVDRVIRLASRMSCFLPAHVWSLEALARVAELGYMVTTAALLPPAALAEALWALVFSLMCVGLLQGAVFVISPSARASLLVGGGLFLAGPLVGALGALLGYSWLVLFHLGWW